MRSRDKLKTFYLHYRNTYAHQTWESGYIYNEELPSIKLNEPLITWSSDFDFSLQYVGLEYKHINPRQFLVTFA